MVIPDTNGHFIVTMDSSGDGVGDALMQDSKVVAHKSKKLKLHEVNYAPCDLELVVIVHALKMWQHYLLGKPFGLKTNHMGLRYIFTQPNLNVRQRQ